MSLHVHVLLSPMSSITCNTVGRIDMTLHESFGAASWSIVVELVFLIDSWPSSLLRACWYRWESCGSSCRRLCTIRFLRPWLLWSCPLLVVQIYWIWSCLSLYCSGTITPSPWIWFRCLFDNKGSIFWHTRVMALPALKNCNVELLFQDYSSRTQHLQVFN